MAQYKYPVIPENITVHLGLPDQPAENVEVPFIDYIKGVTSSEIYPTWPESAIRANVHAQVSYALNRIYTEWYPAQGYNFDITNTTQFDQAYQPGRSIAENINQIVDELFNSYARKGENVEPFFTQYCNGTTSTCPGLSQWGTVYLAEQGYTPLEILRYYYGDEINLIDDAPIQDIPESYPDVPLKFGMRGNDIKLVQAQLNRIRRNFPAIPVIRYVDGVYGVETEAAVRKFQEVFQLAPTGQVDKATWYQIIEINNAVKKLGDLQSEGVNVVDIAPVIVTELVPGTVSNEVRTVQYYLSLIGYFDPRIPLVAIDGIYGPATENAVRQFQAAYGIPVTGEVDIPTWRMMQQVYDETVAAIPDEVFANQARPYPGYVLNIGMQNNDVTDFQTYLRAAAQIYPEIGPVEVTGYFDEVTRDAIIAFQEQVGLPAEGIVGPATWNELGQIYDQSVQMSTTL